MAENNKPKRKPITIRQVRDAADLLAEYVNRSRNHKYRAERYRDVRSLVEQKLLEALGQFD